jgi:hypothetical protein
MGTSVQPAHLPQDSTDPSFNSYSVFISYVGKSSVSLVPGRPVSGIASAGGRIESDDRRARFILQLSGLDGAEGSFAQDQTI